jgi:hypothetical protein
VKKKVLPLPSALSSPIEAVSVQDKKAAVPAGRGPCKLLPAAIRLNIELDAPFQARQPESAAAGIDNDHIATVVARASIGIAIIVFAVAVARTGVDLHRPYPAEHRPRFADRVVTVAAGTVIAATPAAVALAAAVIAAATRFADGA